MIFSLADAWRQRPSRKQRAKPLAWHSQPGTVYSRRESERGNHSGEYRQPSHKKFCYFRTLSSAVRRKAPTRALDPRGPYGSPADTQEKCHHSRLNGRRCGQLLQCDSSSGAHGVGRLKTLPQLSAKSSM